MLLPLPEVFQRVIQIFVIFFSHSEIYPALQRPAPTLWARLPGPLQGDHREGCLPEGTLALLVLEPGPRTDGRNTRGLALEQLSRHHGRRTLPGLAAPGLAALASSTSRRQSLPIAGSSQRASVNPTPGSTSGIRSSSARRPSSSISDASCRGIGISRKSPAPSGDRCPSRCPTTPGCTPTATRRSPLPTRAVATHRRRLAITSDCTTLRSAVSYGGRRMQETRPRFACWNGCPACAGMDAQFAWNTQPGRQLVRRRTATLIGSRRSAGAVQTPEAIRKMR